MARLALLAAAAVLAAALLLGVEAATGSAAPDAAGADCEAEELCLVSIF